jgi:hypothetical protein
MDQTHTGNVLTNDSLPPGTTATVTGISIAGSSTIYPAGSNVTLNDPINGLPIATLVVSPNGTYVFDPVDGYAGPVPIVNVYERTNTGLTAVSALTLDVLPGQ